MNDPKKTVLVIEDEKVLGDILSVRLRQEGYNSYWELDGESGLERMKEIMPDLVLLDIVMPKMDGYEVLEHMSKDAKLKNIPVVVISNSGQPVEIERIVELGAKDYIVKAQFSPEEVLEKVAKYLRNEPEAPAAAVSEMKKNVQILIVEDDPFLSSLASERLSKEGYSVRVATDGEQGLKTMQELKPDLVLLDIIMPVLDGFETLKRMRMDPNLKDVPVVIFSNLGQDHEIEEGKKLGADDFLVKAKFTLKEVIEKIETLLKKHGKLS